MLLSYVAWEGLLTSSCVAFSEILWSSHGFLVHILVDNGSTASFVYGPLGRRISKTIYGVSTGFLYDGANVVQELNGSTPIANLLTGGGGEIFTRMDSSGVAGFLCDGLGSTAELDSTGAVLQRYSYDRYGFTSTNGGSANALASQNNGVSESWCFAAEHVHAHFPVR